MSRVEDMGEEVKAGEKKNFILDVVGTVLFFVPLVGEFAELADTVTALVQIINLIGEVGSAALSVASMIEDPSSASIDIMGFILVRAPVAIWSKETVKSLGSTFEIWDT
jgi:hypothetical protein